MNFQESDKRLIRRFLKIVGRSGVNGLSTNDELWQLVDANTKILIDKVLDLDPTDYGFKGEKLLLEVVPPDAVQIQHRLSRTGGEYELDTNAYLPRRVYNAFTEMATAYSNEYPERRLIVGSGYRSPAFQVVTLFYILAKIYDFDIHQTLKRVAMPQYSQHCSATHTAIDMLIVDGDPSDEDPQKFGDSVEYAWLLKNARTFGFRESYPPNNPDGIMWEPWHWQFVG